MKKYTGVIPMSYNVYVDGIEAESEDEAMGKLLELYDNGDVDFDGYEGNHEPDNYWSVEEIW